ncbi:hypothetical protein MGN70_013393, partial [Eutypa lata]
MLKWPNRGTEVALVRAGATGVGVDLVAEDEHQEEGGSERTGDESSGIPAALE